MTLKELEKLLCIEKTSKALYFISIEDLNAYTKVVEGVITALAIDRVPQGESLDDEGWYQICASITGFHEVPGEDT